jgi:GrpB-like predicted nucleotidyltransferase (UPF0157 family)
MQALDVVIVPYNSQWPGEFQSIAGELRSLLGVIASRIDHIGSTSIPGLAAKDRIDVQISVQSSVDFEAVRQRLEAAGYSMSASAGHDHIPPWGPFEDAEWEKRFFRPPNQKRPTNLHLRVEGRANQKYALLFRDYLRTHPLVADCYAAAKRRLAEYHGNDRDAYCDIKDPICDIIAIGAQSWAEHTGWQPGPSDG